MTIFADRDKPFNWLLSNIFPGISLMVHLSSAPTTINTPPVIPSEHYITLPLPSRGFKIFVPVIIAAMFTPYFKYPTFTSQHDQYNKQQD
jgi:hypothetical protein